MIFSMCFSFQHFYYDVFFCGSGFFYHTWYSLHFLNVCISFSSNLKILSLYLFEFFFSCPILSCLSSGTSVACKFVYFMGSCISLKLFSFSFFTPFIFWIANNNGRYSNLGFPGGSDSKESSCNVQDLGWEDPLEEGMLTHSSILAWRIPMDRGAWWATPHAVAKSQTRLSD